MNGWTGWAVSSKIKNPLFNILTVSEGPLSADPFFIRQLGTHSRAPLGARLGEEVPGRRQGTRRRPRWRLWWRGKPPRRWVSWVDEWPVKKLCLDKTLKTIRACSGATFGGGGGGEGLPLVVHGPSLFLLQHQVLVHDSLQRPIGVLQVVYTHTRAHS